MRPSGPIPNVTCFPVCPIRGKGTAISNLSPAEVTRYERQITRMVGPEAQERLKSSQVLIAGAGGWHPPPLFTLRPVG